MDSSITYQIAFDTLQYCANLRPQNAALGAEADDDTTFGTFEAMSIEALTKRSDLPPEILELILSQIAEPSQRVFHAAALVSRAWYPTAIKYLYGSPILTGKHFDYFIRSVCPSINAHVRYNGLADLIKKLDLSLLVHNGSRSLTARLLGRVKQNLEEFIAPQASFGVNSLAAISKCTRLRRLNLGFVSEAIPISDLLRSIHGLQELVSVHLPRAFSNAAAGNHRSDPCTQWPPNLKVIHVNGGFNDHDIKYLTSLPPSTSEVWLEHCPVPTTESANHFFVNMGGQLETLHVTMPERKYRNWILMGLLLDCHNLRNLSINIEVIGNNWGEQVVPESFHSFPFIERLEIGCLDDHDDEFSYHSLDNMSAYLFSEALPKLRILKIHWRLRWNSNQTKLRRVDEMDNLLKALAREDGEGANISEDTAGVLFFGNR